MSLIGVDCGGTNLAYGLYENPRKRLGGGSGPTPASAVDIPSAIVDAVTPVLDEATAIGIGVAGLVDSPAGTLRWMPHRSETDVAIRSEVADATGLTVIVDNDANLAALAEARLGEGRGHRMVLMVTLGTGIGGGLVVDGEIERGRGFLGEMGHLPISPSGPVCRCGNRGCWEGLVSGRVLDHAAGRLAAAEPEGGVAALAAGATPAGGHLSAAAAAGDEAARGTLEEAGGWLGVGLAGLVAALDPDVIVVGGAAAGSLLLDAARVRMQSSLPGAAHRMETPVLLARLGPEAGVVGAVLAAEDVA